MMDFIYIVVEEADDISEPVTLDEQKAWMVEDTGDRDDEILSMITGGREDIEQLCGIKLVNSTVTVQLNTTCEDEEVYQFPWARNVSEVSALTVNYQGEGADNVLQTINDGYYFNGALRMTYYGRSLISYTVTPVVPQAIKEAIKMLVSYRFKNGGDQDKSEQQGISADVQSKIARFRKIWI